MTAGVARAPHIAADIAAYAVRSALHAIDHEIAESLLVGQLIISINIELVHVAFAARTGIARTLASADDVQLLVVWRECKPVGVGHLILADHQVDAARRIDTIAVSWQLALAGHEPGQLSDPRIDLAGSIAGASRAVRFALVKLAAIGRVGEPVTAVRVRDDVVGRVEPLAIVGIGEHGCSAIVLVAYDPAGKMLAGELPALKVERITIAVVGRRPEDADATIVLHPSHLPIVRNVAPHQIAALRAPRRAFGPRQASIEAMNRRVGLGEGIERRINCDDVGIPEIGGWGAARTEVAWWAGDCGRRCCLIAPLRQRAAHRCDRCAGTHPKPLDEGSS